MRTYRHAFPLDAVFITGLHYSSHTAEHVERLNKAHHMQPHVILSTKPSMPLIVNSKPIRASFRDTFLRGKHYKGVANRTAQSKMMLPFVMKVVAMAREE